jgi:hypothetical protein
MNKIENTNWNAELKFPNIQDFKDESKIEESCWAVSFDWNGYNLTAQVSFEIDLETNTDEGDNYTPDDITVEAVDFSLSLLILYDSECDVFECSFKERNEIESLLLTDLKIML